MSVSPSPRTEELFHKLSFNIPVQFDAFEAFDALRLARERKSARVESLLLDFLAANASPPIFLSCLLKTPSDPGVIRAAALNLRAICQFPNFLSLPPDCICSVVTSPDARPPPRDELDRLVLRALKRHKAKCVALVRMIDFLTADWALLNELHELLRSILEDTRFPALARVIELRRASPDPNLIDETEKAREEEVADLRARWSGLQQGGK
jgi:hypothetical protein